MKETIQQKLNMYQEVYTDGSCLVFEEEQLTVRFRGFFYRFEQFQEVVPESIRSPFITAVPGDTEKEHHLTLTHHYNKEVALDGFRLNILESKEVMVETSNLRGFRYAMEAWNNIIEREGVQLICPVVEINHDPSFEIRGVIEGFYGVPWTEQDRIDLVKYLGSHRMNTYMYAPKDDELQRKRWREDYPQEKLEEFKRLLDVCEEEGVDFYYMISPGNDIDYTQQSEVDVLTKKLQQLVDLGVRHFGLLLDDIDYLLKGNAKRRFKDAASAHAYLIRQVDDYLPSVLEDYTLIVCPTEYDNRYGSPYLEELSRSVSESIPFFWTGPDTLATAITTEDIQKMAEVYQRPIIIWDNTPVNDYQKDGELLFLSPYENRSPRLAEPAFRVKGIVSNPMAQWELSKLTVGHMSRFLWDSHGVDFTGSWKEILSEAAGPEYAEALAVFARFNPNRHTRRVYPHPYMEKLLSGDTAFIERELKVLKEAAAELKNVPNERFQEQIGPWLERAEKDWAYWEIIKTGDKQAIHAYSEQLADFPHRIGLDLPGKYVAVQKLLDE